MQIFRLQGRDATFTCVVNNLGKPVFNLQAAFFYTLFFLHLGGYRVSGETGGAQARVRIIFVYACYYQCWILISAVRALD